MLIPCKIAVIAAAADYRTLWATYTCKDSADIIHYIGVCPLAELFQLPDAVRNTKFDDVFIDRPDKTLFIECEQLWTDEAEAYREQRRLVDMYRPTMNVSGYLNDPRRMSVLCNQTGELFENAAAAAVAHNISHSALINHLNGKAGYKTVKGRTYTRRSRAK